jgi:hypothetical protein
MLLGEAAPDFSAALREDLKSIPDGRAKSNGIDLGRRAAAAILALRQNDGSEHAEPRVGVDYTTGDEPGDWRQDPISLIPLALGARWAEVKPFVMGSARQFRVQSLRAAASLQSGGNADRRANGVKCSGACACPGAGKHRDGRCGHRDLGIQTLL